MELRAPRDKVEPGTLHTRAELETGSQGGSELHGGADCGDKGLQGARGGEADRMTGFDGGSRRGNLGAETD